MLGHSPFPGTKRSKNNISGSTEFKYTFETVSTMRASGAHLADGANDLNGQDGGDGEQGPML